MDFIPRGSFSSLSLTVCSLPCLIQAYVCISGPFERAGGAGELCSFERAGEAGELWFPSLCGLRPHYEQYPYFV